MDLFEYQARDIFEKHGVPVLGGIVATTPDAEFTAARVSYVQGRRSYFAAGTTGVIMRASC